MISEKSPDSHRASVSPTVRQSKGIDQWEAEFLELQGLEEQMSRLSVKIDTLRKHLRESLDTAARRLYDGAKTT